MTSPRLFLKIVPALGCACARASCHLKPACGMENVHVVQWLTIGRLELCFEQRRPHIDLKAKKNREFAENLRQHSVLYRVLQYVLL